MPRDTHGDLHLDHVYHFPDREPPDDLVIIDCIEFNERFRFADPVADMAFLVMDLSFRGRRRPGPGFRRRVLQASGDAEGARCLPFYTAYRAVVRGKVEGFQLGEKEIPEEERAAALATSAGTLAAGARRTGGAGPAAVPRAGRRLARHGQVDPGAGAGRTRRVHGDPLGRRAEGTGRSAGPELQFPPTRSVEASTRPKGPTAPTRNACAARKKGSFSAGG